MDKVLIGFLVIILLIGAAFGIVTLSNKINLDNMLEYVDTFKVDDVQKSLSEHPAPQIDENGNWYFETDDDFKILHLTDVHIGGGTWSKESDKKAIAAVASMVKAENPDLVIITGDISYAIPTTGTINNEYAHKMFIRLMENLGVYWTVTFGNHDNEPYNTHNRQDVANMYADKELERCLFMDSPSGVSGNGNHVINIKNTSGEVTKSLFMLDSHSYIHQDFFGGLIDSLMWNYDSIKQDQIDWYEDMINLYNPQESLMFFHIPLSEVKAGYEEYVANGRELTENVTYFSGNDGEKDEVVYCSKLGDGLFEKIIELNNTKYLFYGHDHFNNFTMRYKGIFMSYGYTIDYIAYGDIGSKGYQRGCTVINLNADTGMVDITHENYYQEKYQSLDEMKGLDMDPNAYK